MNVSTKLSLSQILVESQAFGQGSSRHLCGDKVSCPCSRLPEVSGILASGRHFLAQLAGVWVLQHLQGFCTAFVQYSFG